MSVESEAAIALLGPEGPRSGDSFYCALPRLWRRPRLALTDALRRICHIALAAMNVAQADQLALNPRCLHVEVSAAMRSTQVADLPARRRTAGHATRGKSIRSRRGRGVR
jgi:hypothetical protein